MSMNLRVRRQNQTVFVGQLEPSSSVGTVKESLCEAIGETDLEEIRLVNAEGDTLEEQSTIGELELRNDTLIYWVKRLGGGDFESISN